MSNYLFSIGHGNKSIDEFIHELRLFGIQYLIDVRSVPYSKFYPHFNQDQLNAAINATGDIHYGYMGDSIGGRPQDESCYTKEGQVDYAKIRTKPFFIAGIDRLEKANSLHFMTCIMCSEGEPKMCHRSKLIGEALRDRGICLQHICHDHNGKPVIKTQVDIINEVNKGLSLDLFGDVQTFTSRNAYKPTVENEDIHLEQDQDL
ncbi:MAG: DUF488 domain-containing protein [Bacteroidaceae bacterium]|nr:DUF488 domain-containing protein [Bacteroidaceae bacterium]